MPRADDTQAHISKSNFFSHPFAPVDIASIVFFRIAFGAIMLWEVGRYFSHGWIRRYYIDPEFHFTYYGFGWVQPWPGDGMYLHFYALGALAICILLGLWYRISAVLFFLGFTYVFLVHQSHYLNHFYLICLISFILIFVPAHRALSLDALRRPTLHSDTAPAWALWLLRFQIGVPYFYGGLAKLNSDWLRGEPMRMWLAARTDFPLIGTLFTQEWMVYLFSYGSVLFDLLVVPLLVWKRTRIFAFAIAVVFHLLNAKLFSIGIFPWFMIAATLLFFSPEWPRFGGRWQLARKRQEPPVVASFPLRPAQRVQLMLLGTYVVLQLLVPLRHHIIPGDVNWTEEGHRFAWHMKLRDKIGRAQFLATVPASQRTWRINPRDYLTSRQVRKMSTRPDMILQFSHYIAAEFRRRGYDQIEVRAWVMVSLNGRRHQFLIDRTVNLTAQPRTLLPASWIVPLKEPLPP